MFTTAAGVIELPLTQSADGWHIVICDNDRLLTHYKGVVRINPGDSIVTFINGLAVTPLGDRANTSIGTEAIQLGQAQRNAINWSAQKLAEFNLAKKLPKSSFVLS